ncbi:MAG: serine/threonine protein phosphatase PrpC [Limisphaerales bacterium]|jgi:serine/threonine protein phosphatase PrpC
MKIVSVTHQGLVRINNEDAVAFDDVGGWVALADGMGGLLAGEEASGVAVATAKRVFLESKASIEAVLLEAHQGVFAHAEGKNYVGKMGTTLVLWRWQPSGPEFCHVGDSRIYQYVDEQLTLLSTDQTVAQRMVDEGIIPKDQLATAPNQNVLTQALGMPGMLKPETGSTSTRGRLLLCSDGLSDLVADDVIERSMEIVDLQSCAAELVKLALDRGGRDNITVALIELD